MHTQTALLALLPLVSAHYQLSWPAGRGFSEDTEPNYPCGGFNTPQTTRQALPANGQFPIQLMMEHTGVRGQVNMALGNNPTGNDFNIVLKPVFTQVGPQQFCIGGITIPSGVNVTAGTNATLQIVTNGDPNGGLYQCADVTFTSAALSQSDYSMHCMNSTGVSASFGGASPNGTSSTSGTATASKSGASATAASTSSKAFAPQQTVGAFLLGAAGLLGGLAAL